MLYCLATTNFIFRYYPAEIPTVSLIKILLCLLLGLTDNLKRNIHHVYQFFKFKSTDWPFYDIKQDGKSLFLVDEDSKDDMLFKCLTQDIPAGEELPRVWSQESFT